MAELPEELGATKRPVVLEALRVALGRPAVWLTTWFGTALVALCLALPWAAWFGDTLGSYAPGEQFHSLTTVFRADHRAELDVLRTSTSRVAAGAGFLVMLLGVFAAGGWLQVILERTHGQSLRRFFLGGARYFWRFFRLFLLALLLLHVLGWALYEWPWKELVLHRLLDVPKSDLDALETLSSERTVANLGFLQDGLYALGFAALFVWTVYTRTRIALNDTSSAIVSGLATLFTILRHPLRTLRPLILLAVVEIVLVLGFGFASRIVQDGFEERASLLGVLLLLGFGQLALVIREAWRGAYYCAAVRVSQDLVAPEREDPWSGSIGGPGGPRYPIGDAEDDEYGVSM